MNKQEARQKLHNLAFVKMNTKPDDLKLADVMQVIDQIDEAEKVVIPQFVAYWIEEARKTCRDISDFFEFNFKSEEVKKWFLDYKPFDLVARAWLDGYEVEQEKRYAVKFKNTDDYLVKTNNDDYHFYNNIYIQNRKHTRKELEDAGFGWVFDCEGVEVQEVQEVE